MRTLLKNGMVVQTLTGTLEKENVLIEDERIIGVGEYTDADADVVRDVRGKWLCPGFIDGHIHIESTMLSPAEFSKIAVPHGTTAVVADPHEIANVCGEEGIRYMLESSEDLPMTVYIMLPSCVPATPFCESGATLAAADLAPFYAYSRVLGLAEVMNYVGVIQGDTDLLQKIQDAKDRGRVVNGHAPLLSGKALDAYIAAGIGDDHECTSAEEAMARIRKGQRVMIRQGTAARNLESLLPLFDAPWAERCLLVSDDKHAADILRNGHIDESIRLAVRNGKNVITAIQMATIRAAEAFSISHVGAIAPGYAADILVLDALEEVQIGAVYKAGKLVAENGALSVPVASDTRAEMGVRNSFSLGEISEADFHISATGKKRCRVIAALPGELLTEEKQMEIDFDIQNGIDESREILKLAVIERHKGTGNRGLGFLTGLGFLHGAIASTVSHDAHNLIVIGSSEHDMAIAANRLRALGGGLIAVRSGAVIAEMPLPIGGLMSDNEAGVVVQQNEAVRESARALGMGCEVDPFMTMAFLSLPVIPHLKMTTKGLVDVNAQKIVPLFVEENNEK